MLDYAMYGECPNQEEKVKWVEDHFNYFLDEHAKTEACASSKGVEGAVFDEIWQECQSAMQVSLILVYYKFYYSSMNLLQIL